MVSTEDFDIPEPRCVPGPELRPELETRLRNLEPIFVQESDRRDITRFLGEVEVDFAVYDSIIRDLEEKISKVKAKRSSLQSYADRYRSLLCPARRLPFELVQEIFIFASVAGVEGGNMIGVYSRWESTAMRISSVCHRWRTIALNTPELWASFAVKLERQAREPIELFLSRSKDTPLCLTLMEADDGDDGIAHDDGVLTSLVAHSTRWQSVDWYDLRHTTGLYIIEGIQALPLLQEVVCLAEEEDSAIIHSELLKQCPLLQTVFVRYDFYNNVRVDSLPLASAKDLVFQYGQDGSFTNSLEILRECADTVETISYESIPDLTHFYFFLEASHSPQSPVTPVKCKNVMEMAVNLYSHKGTYPHIRDIFESLTLPSLTSLFLVGDCDKSATNPYGGFEGAWPGLAFENFVIRSRCGITEMEIQGIPIHESELIDVLQRTPTLENFSFAEFCAMDYGDSSLEISPGILVKTINRLILSRLQVQVSESSPTDSKEPLLPKLRRLELRVQRHFDADVQFINMLKSRWYHPASTFVVNPPFRHSSLRSASLYIVGRHGSLEHLYEPIKAIEREGMMVVVNEGGKRPQELAATTFESARNGIPGQCASARYVTVGESSLQTYLNSGALLLSEFRKELRCRLALEIFLSRSKQTPLSLTISEEDSNVSVDRVVPRSLVAHAARWRSVDYYYLHNSSIDIIETITAFPMSQTVVPLAEKEDSAVIQKKKLKK